MRETRDYGIDPVINMRLKRVKANKAKYKRMGANIQSRLEYVDDDKLLLSNPELEMLDLLCELYEREQKGLNVHEKDEDAVKSLIYGRLGELIGMEPNLTFMGEPEHGKLHSKDSINRSLMIGKVLEDVLKKNFKGKYELQVEKAEAALKGERLPVKEIDRNLREHSEIPSIITRNIR